MSLLLTCGMLLIILLLLPFPVWGQDATHQSCSDIMEELMGKLDEFKVNIRKEIEEDLKEEVKLKIEDLTTKMTTLESSLPSVVSSAVRDVPYLMFAAYKVS